MTELQLYKFVTNNDIEYHWKKKHSAKQENLTDDEKNEVLLFVNIRNLEEFNKLLRTSIQDEEGINCTMKQGYFVFCMDYICDYFDIKLENVFTNKNA